MRYLWVALVVACGSPASDEGMDAGAEMDSAMADSATDAIEALDTGRDASGGDPGLLSIEDFEYQGAFRFSSSEFGDSNLNYAVGTLGYNPERRSLFIAGHAQHNAIAEFAIPDEYGTADSVEMLPLVEEPIQEFRQLLELPGNPDGLDRYTGMYWHEGDLIVQANRWYDASGGARDTTLRVVEGDLSGSVVGYYQMEGAAHSAGYMSPIPSEWQGDFGGTTLAGWASNYSIISRHSVGPTLFVFDPSDVTGSDPGAVVATAWMNFSYGSGNYIASDALHYACDREDEVTTCDDDAYASEVWNYISKAMYGFVVPGTRTYAVFGSSGGVESGLGYKIDQDDGNLCGGPCARGADDYYNYYWFFDVEEILSADEVHEPRPYDYGRWSVPFDDDGAHKIIGGAWNPDEQVLYLSLSNAAQVGTYDRPPLILAFHPTRSE